MLTANFSLAAMKPDRYLYKAFFPQTHTGCFFFIGPPPEKLKYGKPRLGKVRCI